MQTSKKITETQFMGHSIKVWKELNAQRRGRWGDLVDDPYWYGSVDDDLVFAGRAFQGTTKKYAIHYCETVIWKRLTKNGTMPPAESNYPN